MSWDMEVGRDWILLLLVRFSPPVLVWLSVDFEEIGKKGEGSIMRGVVCSYLLVLEREICESSSLSYYKDLVKFCPLILHAPCDVVLFYSLGMALSVR